jgi:hypothetical protein
MQVPQDLAAQLVEPDRVFVLARPAGGEYFRLLVRQAATAQRYSRPWQRLELKFQREGKWVVKSKDLERPYNRKR